jgi:hypothetical protein
MILPIDHPKRRLRTRKKYNVKERQIARQVWNASRNISLLKKDYKKLLMRQQDNKTAKKLMIIRFKIRVQRDNKKSLIRLLRGKYTPYKKND